MLLQHGVTSQYAFDQLQKIIQDEVEKNSLQRKLSFFSLLKIILARNGKHALYSWISTILAILDIVLILLYLPLNDGTLPRQSVYLELFIIVVLVLLSFLCSMREVYLQQTEIERLVGDISSTMATSFNANEWSANDQYPDLTLPELNSVSLVWTIRDSRLVNLPFNLLVEGDVVLLGPSRKSPATCRQICTRDGAQPVLLESGDVFMPKLQSPAQQKTVLTMHGRELFEVVEAPLKNILMCYLESSNSTKPTTSNQHTWLIIDFMERYFIWILLLLMVVTNLVRWQTTHLTRSHLLEIFLLQPCYMLLPLLPTIYPLLWTFTGFYGSARLLTLFKSSTKLPDTSNDSEDVRLQHLHCGEVLGVFRDIAMNASPHNVPRTINLVQSVGSITTFSCIDKEGVLCYPQPTPEKLFFFKEHSKVKRSEEMDDLVHVDSLLCDEEDKTEIQPFKQAPELRDNAGESEHHCVLLNDIEIMSLSHNSSCPSGIQFDDVDWKEQMSFLRTISTNILLNSPCTYPLKAKREEDFLQQLSLAGNSNVVPHRRSCMCSFVDKVGVPEKLLEFYQKQQRKLAFKKIDASSDSQGPRNFFLSIVKEKHIPHMISTLLSDGSSDLCQLFTQGSGDLILDACTDLWNGEELSPFKDSEKKKALNFFQRMNITRDCIAFAYRPVFQKPMGWRDEYFEFGESKPVKKSQEDSFFGLQFCQDMSDTSLKSKDQDLSSDEMMNSIKIAPELLDKDIKMQIFLGMMTMVHALKEDVINMIDTLHFAGIRFVHYSYENELLSRVFCQRLGLETGWNCHISLGEGCCTTIMDDRSSSLVSEACPLLPKDDDNERPRSKRFDTQTSVSFSKQDTVDIEDGEQMESESSSDEESSQQDDQYFEPYFMSNRSKLPKGIQKMRSHLSEIDDVPLLVPLFTECNSQGVKEMTCIRQEYGDIVCCFGSSLNAYNYKIFAQSDVSIGLEPILPKVCNSRNRHNTRTANEHELDTSRDSELMVENGPLSLSANLNSMMCSLKSRRKDPFPISSLICEARRLLDGFENLFLFLFFSSLDISLLQMTSCVFFLPPPLTGLQTLWLVVVVLPSISISLVGTPAHDNIMKVLTGKRAKTRVKFYKELMKPFLKMFFPTFGLHVLFMVVIVFPWLLYHVCQMEHGECQSWFLGNKNSTSETWYGIEESSLYLVQDVFLFILTLSFVVLSANFLTRKSVLWKSPPYLNKPWCLSVFVTLLLQVLCNFVSYHFWKGDPFSISVSDMPMVLYAVVIVCLMVLLLFGELVKRRFIRDFKRFQKREKLKFDTKLGMNSPV